MSKVFTVGVSTQGGYVASFQFEDESAFHAWKDDELKRLEAIYGKLALKIYPLPGIEIGETCLVYGEGERRFVVKGLVQFSPHRYGFVLDSGLCEEVGKCYRPTTPECPECQDMARQLSELYELLQEIGNLAHDKSTGPAVPDTLWEIRNMAYKALE